MGLNKVYIIIIIKDNLETGLTGLYSETITKIVMAVFSQHKRGSLLRILLVQATSAYFLDLLSALFPGLRETWTQKHPAQP